MKIFLPSVIDRAHITTMNFGEILELRHRYAFSDPICFISTRSIEAEYNYFARRTNVKPGSLFASWLLNEEQANHPLTHAVYNFIHMNPRKRPMSRSERSIRLAELARVSTDVKLSYLIQTDPTTGAMFLHPMYAVMFAVGLDVLFAVETIGHISGLRGTGCAAENTPAEKMMASLDDREAIISELSGNLESREREIIKMRADLKAAEHQIEKLRMELIRRDLPTPKPKNITRRFCDLFRRRRVESREPRGDQDIYVCEIR